MNNASSSSPIVSVIIPTYNRSDSIIRALRSLCHQTLRPEQFEVIVVDDGSTTYCPDELYSPAYDFDLRIIRQENAGATIARNHGALHSRGEVLIFMDDDVTASNQALEVLTDTCQRCSRVLAMAALVSRSPDLTTVYARRYSDEMPTGASDILSSSGDCCLDFAWTNTQLLAVRRTEFFRLGMLQDPTGGWPNWDDVDFGYRAFVAGYRLIRCARATGVHWDGSLVDLKTSCERWRRASRSAVKLLQRYPDIRPHLPMFHDKVPIAWQQDHMSMIMRKLARRPVSSQPCLWTLERLVGLAEQRRVPPYVLSSLYRWVIGGYIYRGFREGLKLQATERQHKS